MDKEKWVMAGIAAGTIAILAYLLNGKLPLSHAQKQPEKTARPLEVWDDFFTRQNALYFLHPNEINNPALLPVRYPPRPGHELTSLIEKGYAPLFQPRSDLFTWMTCPPTEE